MADWSFWTKALAGENPQSLVRGVPEQGFFLLRERTSTRTPEGERTVGGSRHKVETFFHPTSIWQDESGWHCVISRPDRTSHLKDPEKIDEQIFSRCSRHPITHDNYLAQVKELESARGQ